MFHTSPEKIYEGMINDNGIAGDCLFFSDKIYQMSDASIYVYEADFNCIEACKLYDKEIVQEIAEKFSVDEETAENLLNASCGAYDLYDDEFFYRRPDMADSIADLAWWLQGKRGECAKKLGYDGCEDIDEQGTVYIIPMKGREKELNLVEILDY